MNELEAASTDELVAELFSRFDHAVFAAVKVVLMVNETEGQMDMKRRWKGNQHTCVGIAHHIANEIIEELDKGMNDE